MIPQSKIEEIIQAANIEQVVGDVVRLKRRGANLLGSCPFHQEKTPSFTVSPSKGIYKCFGCGKAGNAVNFVMEHESVGYLEALKSLADRYQIDWPQQENTNIALEKQIKSEKDSLQILNNWSLTYFEQQLWETQTGKDIGLSYFEERGFTEQTIRKFHLGYSQDSWDDYLKAAENQQFNEDILSSSGLIKKNDQGRVYDAYRGRVIFPIHGSNGKVIAFAGRQLKKDEKSPKYVNSPETLLYHKSNELYGLYFAKQSIRLVDFVYLVEGYTDVISLVQAGIENVVASSGTSLTENQIKLIKRHTDNVTVLYDGDAAGIKASMRGIDMLLEQGLNVKVVLFPDGEDPDSYCKKIGFEPFGAYLKDNSKDFILFKVGLLLKDSAGDPILKAKVTRDILESISKIPDSIKRMAFIRECARLLEMNEQVLILELNKLRKDVLSKQEKEWVSTIPAEPLAEETILQIEAEEEGMLYQEKYILRMLILHGGQVLDPAKNETAAQLILKQIEEEELEFENEQTKFVFTECKRMVGEEIPFTVEHFTMHANPLISSFTAGLLAQQYEISPAWQKKYDVIPEKSEIIMRNDVASALLHFKLHNIRKLMKQNYKLLEEAERKNDEQELFVHQNIHTHLKEKEIQLSQIIGLVVLH